MTTKNNEDMVRFSETINTEEDEERRGGIVEAQPIPDPSPGRHDDVAKRRLSFVSQQYDIDGDGQLDKAELAMRNLDKSGRGFLTNEKVYALMTEQLAMQSKIFQFKKIIIGLSAFIFVLALSNLATSFASAILAKDTASEGGSLIDTKTRDALSTSQALKMYAVGGEGGDENERRLRKLQAGEIENLPVDQALEMLLKCYKGTEIVTVQYDEGLGHKVTRVICAPDHCATSSFTFQDSAGKPCSDLTFSTCVPVAGELCTVSFQKSSEGFYTIKLPAEGSGGGFVASSGGGFVPSSGGGYVASSGGIPLPPIVN